jgi:segregation and condensation protein B
MEKLEQHIEAIIFAAEKPVKVQEIRNCLEKINAFEVDEELVVNAISAIEEKLRDDGFAFQLVQSGGGYQFLTKPAYHETVAALLHQNARRRLTNAAMETLSIIAYKQPVTKTQIEQIRGVNSDYTVNKLMEKELVEIVGRSNDVGKPLLYGTSAFFMDYFGINSIEELPKIKEFTDTENQIGVLPDIEQASEN